MGGSGRLAPGGSDWLAVEGGRGDSGDAVGLRDAVGDQGGEETSNGRTALPSSASGGLVAGGRLPTEARLCEEYGVARGTLRQALALLRAEGLISAQRGSGRVVLSTARMQSFAEVRSFTQWARLIGQDPGALIDSLVLRPADAAERERFRLDGPGAARVCAVDRLRTLSGRPVMVEHTLYPGRIGDLVAGFPRDAASHYNLLKEHGIRFASASHVIDVVPAGPQDARLLGCTVGGLLLRERRQCTDPSGVPVEYSADHYLPGTVAFSMHSTSSATAFSRHSRL